MCNATVCFPYSDAIDFEINLIFYDQKNKKFKCIENERAFKVKYKALLIILKSFQVTKIVSDVKVRLYVNLIELVEF